MRGVRGYAVATKFPAESVVVLAPSGSRTQRGKAASVPDLRSLAVVASGAAIGGVARFLIASLALARNGKATLPVATLAINVSGSFLIGIVVGIVSARPGLSPLWRIFLATGILGGYTTFSTFSLDALDLARGGAPFASLAYVCASVIAGIAAAYAGLALVRAL